MHTLKYLASLVIVTLAFGCSPFIEEKPDIGPPPNPSFVIMEGDTPNDFILQNTTEGTFLTNWEFENNGNKEGQEVTVTYGIKGDYEVTMTTFNKGGYASITKTLTVTQDAEGDCTGNLELITGCTEKVWKLAQEAGAIHVGPSLNETWWGNSTGDLTDRDCHFNDEYIFRVDGEYEYDNKGDFWADDDGSGNIYPPELGLSIGCHPSTDWPTDFAAWDSGIHAFTITETTLTVIGNGAWLGLYKIGTTGDVTEPQESVTFSISEISETRMVLFSDYGGTVWRITMTSE